MSDSLTILSGDVSEMLAVAEDRLASLSGAIVEIQALARREAKERAALRAENATFRAAQKACEDCDAPTKEETDKLRAENSSLWEENKALRERLNQWSLNGCAPNPPTKPL